MYVEWRVLVSMLHLGVTVSSLGQFGKQMIVSFLFQSRAVCFMYCFFGIKTVT